MKNNSVIDDIGDDLCKYCPLDKNKRGLFSTPGGMSAGCEGSHCDVATEEYLYRNKIYLRKKKIEKLKDKI